MAGSRQQRRYSSSASGGTSAIGILPHVSKQVSKK